MIYFQEVFYIVIGLTALWATVYVTYRVVKFFDPKCDVLEGDITDRW